MCYELYNFRLLRMSRETRAAIIVRQGHIDKTWYHIGNKNS